MASGGHPIGIAGDSVTAVEKLQQFRLLRLKKREDGCGQLNSSRLVVSKWLWQLDLRIYNDVLDISITFEMMAAIHSIHEIAPFNLIGSLRTFFWMSHSYL
jgi:hypothetical protein